VAETPPERGENAASEAFALTTSRHFPEWLDRMQASLAFTTYQAGKLFLLGLSANNRIAVFERTFERCMGMAVYPNSRSFLLATRYQIFRFDNVLPNGAKQGEHDALFVPHQAWITGDLDVHDVVLAQGGHPLFVNTLFSCLAEPSEGFSFKPVWKPEFITKLAAEDRCHLNGVATADGVARYATLVADSNVSDGWRDRRAAGGVVIDVITGERIGEGLSMPHSPRLHNGKLWLLNSGTGEFGYVENRKFVPITFCPGYPRGLAFAGNHAVIGLSLPRENRTFQGLPLNERLKAEGTEARCGLIVVDIQSGEISGWVRIEGVVRELYDVAVFPGVRNAAVIGFKTDEITRIVSVDES
jgi:uncharacterized protein (TIGR03032 family)